MKATVRIWAVDEVLDLGQRGHVVLAVPKLSTAFSLSDLKNDG